MVLDVTHADPDLAHGHPWLQARWPLLESYLNSVGYHLRVIEVYRAELRQQWLYGAGRTVEELSRRSIAAAYARPREPCVTNAWSAGVSAHGFLLAGAPAAAALDVVPCGPDGRPWTADDPWTEFVVCLAAIGPGYGLVHFHAPGKAVWDRPHLQLIEYQDATHTLWAAGDLGRTRSYTPKG